MDAREGMGARRRVDLSLIPGVPSSSKILMSWPMSESPAKRMREEHLCGKGAAKPSEKIVRQHDSRGCEAQTTRTFQQRRNRKPTCRSQSCTKCSREGFRVRDTAASRPLGSTHRPPAQRSGRRRLPSAAIIGPQRWARAWVAPYSCSSPPVAWMPSQRTELKSDNFTDQRPLTLSSPLLANPTSRRLPSASLLRFKSTYLGLRFRWVMPWQWQYASARRICLSTSRAWRHGKEAQHAKV